MRHSVGLLIFAIFFGWSSTASAQITITADEYFSALNNSKSASGQSFNDTSSADAAILSALVSDTGANQVWDFSKLTYSQPVQGVEDDTTLPYSSTFPAADSFASATIIKISSIMDLIIYNYVRETSSGVFELGAATVQAGNAPKIAAFDPPVELVGLPMTYQTSWSNFSHLTMGGMSLPYYQKDSVDGFGTLILPGNKFEPCLRLREVGYYALALSGNDTTVLSYSWITASGRKASISATPGSGGLSSAGLKANYSQPTSPSSSVASNPAEDFSVRLAANPLTEATSLTVTLPAAETVRIRLMNLLGDVSHNVMEGMGHAGQNIIRIDPETLPNGVYFLRVESGAISRTQKIVVVR